MNEAFNERMIGASLSPATSSNRLCWAGKNPHAVKPQTTTEIKTGAIASTGERYPAHTERLASAAAMIDSSAMITRRAPTRSLAVPPNSRPEKCCGSIEKKDVSDSRARQINHMAQIG